MFKYEKTHGKDDSLRRSDGRYAKSLSLRVVEGGMEETGDYVHATRLDFATSSYVINLSVYESKLLMGCLRYSSQTHGALGLMVVLETEGQGTDPQGQ
jgi:hypothetical protein